MKRKTKKILSIELSEYENKKAMRKDLIDEILYPHVASDNLGIRAADGNGIENKSVNLADELTKLRKTEKYKNIELWISITERLEKHYKDDDLLKYTIFKYKFSSNGYIKKFKKKKTEYKKKYTDIEIIKRVQLEGYNIEKVQFYKLVNDILNDAYVLAINYRLMTPDIFE